MMTNEVRLVRSSAGRMVHRSDCGYLARARNIDVTEWPWAQGKSLEEIRTRLLATGNVACQGCRPLRSDDVR